MNLSENELARRFPNISASCLRANSADNQLPSPKPKRPVRHEPLAAPAREKGNVGRVVVRIKSFRCRLLDPDNLCPKYFIDGLRYAGLIAGDSPQEIVLEVRQEKVATRKEEHTLIEIEPILSPGPQSLGTMTPRQALIETLWNHVSASWNREAFNSFMQTLDEEALKQYIRVGTP